MKKHWISPQRDQIMLLPPSIDEWLPENHLARFVVEIVDKLDLSPILNKYNALARGSTPYHPSMLVALLFYGYSTGVMSSRKIELATRESVPFRFIAGGYHPDHATISEFRRRHLAELSNLFHAILLIAKEMGFLKVGAVALDGTKIKANASKHAAVSYQHAKAESARLRAEIEKLMRAAEAADNTPLREGIDIPAEITRRVDRAKKLDEARLAIYERHGDEALKSYTQECEQVLENIESAVEKALAGEPPSGESTQLPEPPTPSEPPDKAQYNFTDPESRIMPDKGGFSQCYNAQASADTETMLIVGNHLTQNTNDKREFLPGLRAIPAEIGVPTAAIADCGYFSKHNIAAAPSEMEILIAAGRTPHNQPLDEKLGPHVTLPVPPGATAAETMRHKLKTEAGSQLYRLRKMTIEPIFGIIKQALGFRQFLLRGFKKARGEWAMVCTGYNLKRLWNLKMANQS